MLGKNCTVWQRPTFLGVCVPRPRYSRAVRGDGLYDGLQRSRGRAVHMTSSYISGEVEWTRFAMVLLASTADSLLVMGKEERTLMDLAPARFAMAQRGLLPLVAAMWLSRSP